MTEPTRLSFGIKTTPQNVSFADILRVWAEADTIPVIEHAWLWDHLQPMRGDTSIPVLEGWTALAALAARTHRLRLGLVVTNSPVPASASRGWPSRSPSSSGCSPRTPWTSTAGTTS